MRKFYELLSIGRKQSFALLLAIIMFFIVQSCKSPTAPSSNRLSLTVEDVSCTEAWLKLTLNNIPLPTNIEIKKNGSSFLSFILTSEDTTIYDSTLLPNQTYSYQADYRRGFATEKSETISAKTMDTTSNNFTWQTFSFGVGGDDNTLNDVVIINDTSIWAVGKFSIQDSGTYNTARWDGKKWNMERIYYPYQGQNYFSEIKSIFAFSENDIWVGMNQPMHWNGVKWETYDLGAQIWNGWINKIWGTSNNVYIAGANGELAHYDGKTWQKIQSGTSEDLYDIYSNDGKTIYAAGGNYMNYNGVLLKGNSNSFQILEEGKDINAEQFFNPYFGGVAASVWVSNTNKIYFGAELLYRYAYGKTDLIKSLPGNYLGGNSYAQNWGLINKIRGNNDNDIIMVGERNTIRHFNGVHWQQLGMPYDPNSNYDWFSVSIKDNTIVTVGFQNMNAVIMVLKRQ